MKLRNKSTDRLKRTDEHGRFIRIEPGETMEVPDGVGEYLLTAEKHYWELDAPAPKQKPQRKEAE